MFVAHFSSSLWFCLAICFHYSTPNECFLIPILDGCSFCRHCLFSTIIINANFGHWIINGISYLAVKLTPFMPNKFKMAFEFLVWLLSFSFFFFSLHYQNHVWYPSQHGIHFHSDCMHISWHISMELPWINLNNIRSMSYKFNRIDVNVIIFHQNRFDTSDDLIFRRHLLFHFDRVLNFKLTIESNHFLGHNLIRYVVDIHQCHYMRFIYRFFQSNWKLIRSHFQ